VRFVVAAVLLAGWLAAWPMDVAADAAITADRVLVVKSERKLYLMRTGRIFAAYWIALGTEPVGPKTRLGDGKTPEGIYTIDERIEDSVFHRALHISYPGPEDRDRAAAIGVHPGGGIAIHGLPPGWEPIGPGRPMMDWTNGCIALTNHDLDEIWDRIPLGTTIEIRP
jgi:murein L,D-transpeptidase YafK